MLDAVSEPGFRARAEELGRTLRARLDELAARRESVGEVRGLGPMLALELREPAPELAQATTAAAFERGLLLLACGLHGNVLRLLPPLTISDEELAAGSRSWRSRSVSQAAEVRPSPGCGRATAT